MSRLAQPQLSFADWDTVRTVTRLLKDLHEILSRGVAGFTNRTRSARRRMQELERMTT